MEEKLIEKLYNKIYNHPIATTIIITSLLGVLVTISYGFDEIFATFFWGVFLGFPLALLFMEIMYLVFEANGDSGKYSKVLDVVVLGIGSLYEYFYLSLIKDITYNDWSVQLTNNEHHSPVFTEAVPTVVVIFF